LFIDNKVGSELFVEQAQDVLTSGVLEMDSEIAKRAVVYFT